MAIFNTHWVPPSAVRAYSQQAKAEAKAKKKDERTSKKDQILNGKRQKFSLSLSLPLGLNTA